MGYYHGYKRYRFVKKSNSDGILPLSSFKEIEAIYNFDMELKGLFYPIVMLVETALKNRTIDSIVAESSSGIEDILEHQLACYMDYPEDHENMVTNSISIMKLDKMYWIQLTITQIKMR